MSPSAETFALPDGFQLVRKLGEGGYGEVWQGNAPGGVPVALKFLRFDPANVASELRALDPIKKVRHAHLLTLFGVWPIQNSIMLAMELADGTLLDRARQCPGGVIPQAELLEYTRQAAEAIDHLNRNGIQHRDVKPQNLLLVPGSILKVADFGLAKLLEHSVTAASGRMTPAYAPPEFFHEQATNWSDQYSLAVTYCQLRGGRLPFAGNAAQILAGHLTRDPDLSMLPEAERPALAKALAKNPRERWPNCRAFVAVLKEATMSPPELAGETLSPVLANPESTVRTTPLPHSSPGYSVWLLALPGLMALGVSTASLLLVLWLYRNQFDTVADRPSPLPTQPVASSLGEKETFDSEQKADQSAVLLKQRGATLTLKEDSSPIRVVGVKLSGEVSPETLALVNDLRELKTLDLSGSGVDDAALARLKPLSGLQSLKLNGCTKISGTGFRHVALLPPLEELEMDSTTLADSDLAYLKGLFRLKKLSCANCKSVTDEGLKHVATLLFLDSLQLDNTAVSDAGLEQLKGSTRLKTLRCGHCKQITDQGVQHLSMLKSLETLSLDGSLISNSGLERLKALTELKSLSLGGCKTMTNDGLQHLAGLTKLATLNLENTNISKSGLDNLPSTQPLTLSLKNCPNLSEADVESLKSTRSTYWKIQR